MVTKPRTLQSEPQNHWRHMGGQKGDMITIEKEKYEESKQIRIIRHVGDRAGLRDDERQQTPARPNSG